MIEWIVISCLVGTSGVVGYAVRRRGKRLEAARALEDRHRRQRELPPADPPSPPRTTYASTEFEKRLERQGITVLHVDAYESCPDEKTGESLYFYEAPDRTLSLERLLERRDPASLDRTFAFRRTGCAHCRGSSYQMLRIVKQDAPYGAHDLGFQRLLPASICCSRCGRAEEYERTTFPGILERATNILDWLDARERESVPSFKQERLMRLRDERARLRRRFESLESEIARLRAELRPRTDLDPFRGTPLEEEPDAASETTP